jgi:hypothetical protein
MTALRRDKNANVIQVGTGFVCVNQALTTASNEITPPANAVQVSVSGGILKSGFYFSHNGTVWNYADNVTLDISKGAKFYLKGVAAMTAELTYNIAAWD